MLSAPTSRKASMTRASSPSLNGIGANVGASATSCWRRIKALEDVGVLKSAVRLVDPAGVGRSVSVMLHVRMKTHSREKHKDFDRFVRTRPEVMECYSMWGEWDYLLRIVVPDVSAYQRFLMEDPLTFPDVAASASHFALSQVKYTTTVPV
jgi:DNA-binding Lrp family transcriptional regulator